MMAFENRLLYVKRCYDDHLPTAQPFDRLSRGDGIREPMSKLVLNAKSGPPAGPSATALPVLGGAAFRPARRSADPSQALGEARATPPIVSLVALGCAKNLVDSEKMLGQIAESGALISGDESVADTVVVNTCGFLASSRTEALEVLAELAERKRRGKLRRIVVAGCLVQRDGQKIRDAIPEIDALVGVNNRGDVVRAVWRTHAGERRLGVSTRRGQKSAARGAVDLYLGDYHGQPWSDTGRLRLTPRHYAYVRISEGCNQKCTFCTIPSIRGPMHCKTAEELVAECRELIADGAHELILIGQDTTSYGADIGYEPGLAGLLRTLNRECAGARWIRLMYVYPSVLTDAMIDAIAECQRIVKYVDIPLQHIHDRMLKRMHRRVTRAQTEALLERIRQRIPGVAIRTTFIVGFPGETQAEFEELLTFVHDFGFDAAGAFMYSLEAETPAGRMSEQLDAAVKRERYERLMLAQQEVAFTRATHWLGREFEVLVDGPAGDDGLSARHAGQAPEVDASSLVRGSDTAVGQFATVRCVGTAGYDLVVEPAAGGRQARRASLAAVQADSGETDASDA